MVKEWNSQLDKSSWCRRGAGIIYRMLRISLHCRSSIVIYVKKYVTQRIYLITTDNIIVLDHVFNLMKKSNLIGRL